MSYTDLLIHTCDIGALSQGAQDAYGKPAETWPLGYTDEPCRLLQTAGREIIVGAKVFVSDWKVFLGQDVSIDEQDRISNVKDAATGVVIDAGTYEVLRVKPVSNGLSIHHYEADLRRVV